MAKCRKYVRIGLTSKLPNNSIISVDFGTELEEETDNEKELLDKVYQSTINDIKEKAKTNKLIRTVWESASAGIKQQEKIEKSLEELE